MAEGNRVVTVGVDTHKDAHVAAALDASGALLGTASFPADARGYASMVAWMRAFGRVEAAGVEGTGGYGAGLARALDAAGVRVLEVSGEEPAPGRMEAQARTSSEEPLPRSGALASSGSATTWACRAFSAAVLAFTAPA